MLRRIGALLLACAALGAGAKRMEAASMAALLQGAGARPRNATRGGRARSAALSMLPLLAAAPGAEAFDLERLRQMLPPKMPSSMRSTMEAGFVGDAGTSPMGGARAMAENWLRGLRPLQDAIADVGRQLGSLSLPQTQPAKKAQEAPKVTRKMTRKMLQAEELRTHVPATNSFVFSGASGVVVKEVVARTPQEENSAAREVAALSRFGGGDIVRLLGSRVERLDDGSSLIAMSLEAADGNLNKAVLAKASQLSVPADQKVRMIVEILRGLSKLNRAGWVHRDVKPDNILVFGKSFSADGSHVKLADFEHACPLESLAEGDESLPKLVGSPMYMAPEVWQGEGDMSKMDVWSAGMVAYELMTGSQPRDLVTKEAASKLTLLDHPFRDFVPQHFEIAADPRYQELAGTDPQLAQLIRRMLTKSVAHRPAAEVALAHARTIAAARGIAVPLQGTDAEVVAPAAATAAWPAHKSLVYRANGFVVKELHTANFFERGRAEAEVGAMKLFGGGDIISLVDSKVKSAAADAATYFLKMEAADANLDAVIRADAAAEVPMANKVRMLVEVLRGLEKMESAGWLHTDLSPHNVLVLGDCTAPEGCHAKLGGLRSAAPLDAINVRELSDHGLYTAPEVRHGRRDISKADVWSAGMLAFELLAGKVPEDVALSLQNRRPNWDWADLAIDEGFQDLQRRDPSLARLVRRMLTRSVAYRPKAKQALEWAKRIAAARYGLVVPPQSVREVEAAARPESGKRMATKVYEAGDGVMVKEVHALDIHESRRPSNEISALELFGGGDVVRLLASRSDSVGGGQATYFLSLEAADSNLFDGVIEKERGMLTAGVAGVPHGLKVQLLAQILRGLTKVHNAGWVHGDIRPENILVFGECFSQEGCHAKLADFEHARPLEIFKAELSNGARSLGAPQYRAPEVWHQLEDVSKADVWSAGMMAFELFVGRLPEAVWEPEDSRDAPIGETFREFVPTAEEIKEDPGFVQLGQRDPQLAKLIQRMLSESSAHRPSPKAAYDWARSIARREGVSVPEQRGDA